MLCEKKIQREGETGSSASACHIQFYIMSDNSFFILGITRSVDVLTERLPVLVNNIHMNLYRSGQAFALYNDYFSMSCNQDCLRVIIADKDYLSVVALALSGDKIRSTLFIPSIQCTEECLKRIIEVKNNKFRYNSILPKFTLLGTISTREKRVCYYLYHGFSMKLIGTIMGIHPKTVSGYRSRIMRKIGCKSKGEFNKTLIKYFHLCLDK
ncbi:helix-turn-helix transcriptional regulator [Klebsiella aerogenes]|uniref:helix-turn-helix transcriptional regulator n=1 Tax=Klebsiella aerogenes TaxID=548 RepID=UPI001867B21E|nr:helix-turn-helix transcriptional regulator [Klebsiella aerogenes]